MMDPSLLKSIIGNLDLGFDFSRHNQNDQSPHSNNTSKQKNKVTRGTQIVVNINGAPFDQRVLVSDEPTHIPHSSVYSAVFLTNGQVYFGKLSRITAATRFAILRDVYYLRELSDDQLVSVDLIKVGSELHAPHDQMHININHILFWQPIQDAGPIATAIQNYSD